MTQNPLAGEFIPPPEKQFYSTGMLCQMLQITPAALLQMMRACDVQFAQAVDGVGYIRGDDVQLMFDSAQIAADKSRRAAGSN